MGAEPAPADLAGRPGPAGRLSTRQASVLAAGDVVFTGGRWWCLDAVTTDGGYVDAWATRDGAAGRLLLAADAELLVRSAP